MRRSGSGNDFDGIVGVSACRHYFEHFYAKAGNAEDDFVISLVRSDGEELVRFPVLPDAFKFGPAPFSAALQRSEAGTFSAASVRDGVPRLFFYGKIEGHPLSVFYSIDKRTIFRQWQRHIMIGGVLPRSFPRRCSLHPGWH